jgi:tRNA1(Val) A37 N6-methylase TrmN6
MTSLAKKRASAPQGRTGTTTDDFLGGRLSIVQPRAGHRAGSDAVFLAAAVPATAGERVLEVGAGVGVAGLCLLARVPNLEVTAVEIDEKLCALAEDNAARNGFADRFAVVEADITASGKILRAAGLAREGYDQVIANPPFHAEGAVRAAPDAARARAHVMQHGALAAWVKTLTAMAAPGSVLTLIHKAECLGEIIELLHGRFGDVAVFPLFPKPGGPATRIIVQGRKGSRAGLRLLPGLVLHGPGGAYAAEAEALLSEGAALSLVPPQKKKGPPPQGVRRQPRSCPSVRRALGRRKVR